MAMIDGRHRAGSVEPVRPRVFVCYAHESEPHKELVRCFAEFLQKHGIDVHIDIWSETERRDWGQWAIKQITEIGNTNGFILVIASPKCRRVGDGEQDTDEGSGIQCEMDLLRNKCQENVKKWQTKILPIILPGCSCLDVPQFLGPRFRDYFLIRKFTVDGAEELLRLLTSQPKYVPPSSGPAPDLPVAQAAYTSDAAEQTARQIHPESTTPNVTRRRIRFVRSQRLVFVLILLASVGTMVVKPAWLPQPPKNSQSSNGESRPVKRAAAPLESSSPPWEDHTRCPVLGPDGRAGDVKIRSPREGNTVGTNKNIFHTSGTVHLLPGEQLWLMFCMPGRHEWGYQPQNPIEASGGHWEADLSTDGSTNNAKYSLCAVIASSQVSASYVEQLKINKLDPSKKNNAHDCIELTYMNEQG